MSTLPPAGVYNVDTVHSTVGFVARHLVAAKVRGHFNEFAGVITIGDSIENSSVEATVQAASVTTNNEMRDGHLKSGDFLEEQTYPTLTLKSTKITSKGGDKYELVADLTIKDVTKAVTFDLEYLGTGPSMTPGASVVGFELSAEIDRREFNVNFDGALENGSLVVGNKIVLELAVEAHQQA
ncbi:MAG: YceI family protein [Acidimicrobiales bacterium]